MASLLVLIVFLALCVLAAARGVDSRPVEARQHRPNWL
jgi:hypothetical protein